MRTTLVCLAAVLALGAAPPAPSGKLAALIEQLGDDDFDKREDASEKFQALGDSAIMPLYRATSSNDPEIRRRATRLHRDLTAKLLVCSRQRATGWAVVGVAFTPDGKHVVS